LGSRHLVEEDILAITALGCEILEVAILADAVFLAELLPELTAHFPWLMGWKETPRVSERDII